MDWPIVAAAWLLLLCSATLMTSGALYGDGVALGGLRAALAAAPAADRSIVISIAGKPASALVLDPAIRTALAPIAGIANAEVAAIITSSAFARAGSDANGNPILTEFSSYQGIERHAAIEAGRWATAGAIPQEATLSSAAAGVLGVAVGDRLTLVSRLDPTLTVDLKVTGTWQAKPGDPFWLDAPLEVGGSKTQGTFTIAGPFVVPAADLVARPFGDQRSFEWRVLIPPEAVPVDAIGALRIAAGQLPARLSVALPTDTQFRVATALPAILTVVDRSLLVSRAGVLLLVIQYAVLALYAIVLVAGMLSDRRRAETALLRTRGASSLHLASMALFEALVLAISAAAVAPLLALLAVGWLGASQPLGGIVPLAGMSTDALVMDGAAAIVGILALTLPTLSGGASLAGVRAAISRQTGSTLARRLGLDLALVVVGAIALWQLRLYGAPITRDTRGLLGIDPLLVAAPAIGLLAGAVIATRLLPRAMELLQGPLERSRGLVAPMGGRGLARRPLRYTRSVLLLMLAASLGTFAAAHVATWTRSQADQAAYQIGANARVVMSPRAAPGRTLARTIEAMPGVRGVMAVDRVTVDAGRTVRGGPLLAIDAAQAGGIMNGLPTPDGAAIGSLLGLLVTDRPSPPGVAIPAGTRRLGIVMNTGFVDAIQEPGIPTIDLATFSGISVSLVIVDGLGRVDRVSAGQDATFIGMGQRIVVDLAGPGGAIQTVGPLQLAAVELSFDAPAGHVLTGTTDFLRVDASSEVAPSSGPPTSGSWTSLGLGPTTPGWSWQLRPGNQAPRPLDIGAVPGRLTFDPTSGEIGPVFNGAQNAVTVVLRSVPAQVAPVAAIASSGFLVATAAHVGDSVTATLDGVSQSVRVIGTVGTFPTLDPSTPFLVVDDRALAFARYVATGDGRAPTEWWVSTADPSALAVAIHGGPDPSAEVLTTSARARELLSDPLPRGVIGVLGLGSLAALVFASIGFIVSATASARERSGEFALLRALGLSGRELSAWLAIEQTLLLILGAVLGLGLGVLLAWLVLPFTALTAAGTAAVPAPAVIIPWSGLAPIAAAALVVLAATLAVLRRTVLAIRIGDVLRGRDD